jgi:hypothetical protein
MDSARRHNSRLSQECIQVFRAERLSHPAPSRYIASSDLFLGYLKETMFDDLCASRPDVLEKITDIFSQIDKEVLVRVFKC